MNVYLYFSIHFLSSSNAMHKLIKLLKMSFQTCSAVAQNQPFSLPLSLSLSAPNYKSSSAFLFVL